MGCLCFSIVCSHPFEGAEGNMSRAIDNVIKKSSDEKPNGEVETPSVVFHRFAKQLLILAETWFWGNVSQIFTEVSDESSVNVSCVVTSH